MISKKTFCTLEAVLTIAYNASEIAISGAELAQAQSLPERYLEPILQRLVHAGILRSIRGAQGGYLLARERRRITLADIAYVLDTPDEMPLSHTVLGTKIIQPQLHLLATHWQQIASTITLETLCAEAKKQAIPQTNEPHNNFAI